MTPLTGGRPAGFTLLEVLIVLVIMTVMAGLAVPGYISSVEKSRKLEALQVLGAIRASEQRYFTGRGTYTGTIADLDFDPTVVAGGVTVHYTYAIVSAGPTFSATALRNGVDYSPNSGCGVNYFVAIDETGAVFSNC